MNYFKLLNKSRLALSRESEIELNYLFGKKFNYIFTKRLKEFQYVNKSKPRFTGLFFQCLIFFYNIIKNLSLYQEKVTTKEIYIFAGTINQLNTIQSSLKTLDANGNNYILSVFKNLKNSHYSNKNIKSVKYNIKVVLNSLVLFLIYAFPLFLKLKKDHKDNQISWYFNKFCEPYIFLPYFIDQLNKIKPKLVVVTNDHAVYVRSLRVASEIMGIKTVYMQHASVSEIYPPLEFNYALLDGKIAHQIYEDCYYKYLDKSERLKNNIKNCNVILTGMKKSVSATKIKNNYVKFKIGIAVNKQDDFYYLQNLLKRLNKMNIGCIIRTHPYQSSAFIKQLMEYIKDKSLFSWSNSREQQVTDFFIKIKALIAGNTSIHLEAALAGLPTFYYGMSKDVFMPDYYGYVKHNLSEELEENFSYEIFKSLIEKGNNAKNRNYYIKQYSETFKSLWQNKEGQLSGIIINRILTNKSLEDLFDESNSKIYCSIRNLKNL